MACPDIDDPYKHVVGWTLVAHCMYDAASNINLLLPTIVNKGGKPWFFTAASLHKLAMEYNKYNAKAAEVYFNDASKRYEIEKV